MRAYPPAAIATADGYFRRIAALRALVDEVAPMARTDPRWWALLPTVAAAETRRPTATYLLSDAGLETDTFMAWPSPRPASTGGALAEAVGLARAARVAIGELDGTLEHQPLAGTIAIDGAGARLAEVELDAVAFAIGSRVAVAPLAASDAELVAALARLARGAVVWPLTALGQGRPFCTISVGDDAWSTARHGHRRAWIDGRGGPWLGLARSGEHLVVSTCHYAIDGFGHGLVASRIAGAAAAAPIPGPPVGDLPALAPVRDAAPLAVASRPWPGPPRAAALAYRLGSILGDDLGVRRGVTPTIQIPVAPGARGDGERWRRRVVPALVSVRWHDGRPEPEAVFLARAGAAIAREATGAGLATRVYAAGRALPVPVRWKRRLASALGEPPALFAPLYDVIAGRACVSVIAMPAAVGAPPLVAASAPARTDAIGSTVVTVVDSGAAGATVTVTGSGRWGSGPACAALIDRLVAP